MSREEDAKEVLKARGLPFDYDLRDPDIRHTSDLVEVMTSDLQSTIDHVMGMVHMMQLRTGKGLKPLGADVLMFQAALAEAQFEISSIAAAFNIPMEELFERAIQTHKANAGPSD